MRVFFSFALLTLAVFPQKENDKAEQLKEAQRLLRGNQEETIRQGAKLCLRLDCQESIELLLDVLRARQPHSRDIVWEVLPSFKDLYARRMVENELNRDGKNPDLKAWCADLLGRYGDGIFAKSLENALRHPDIEVRRAAARSLGKLKQKSSVKPLLLPEKDRDYILRANATESLAQIDPAGFRSDFLASLKDHDPGVRCALLGALPSVYSELAEEYSAAALGDEDWRPRMQAVENLANIRTKGSIDGLVVASGDGRPVVQQKAIKILGEFTGKNWPSRELWEGWWKENRANFEFPEKDKKRSATDPMQTTVTYNGLRVASDHVAFLIDTSMQMTEQLNDGRIKHVVALNELDEVLKRLVGRKMTFNVFAYSDRIQMFEKKNQSLDEKTRKAAIAFISKWPRSGMKDIWEALSTTMADGNLDTVYLLSSGEPEVGLYVHWNRVTEHLKDLNRFHKVVIHTIAYNDNKWYRDQLEKIAEATGGEFKYFE